MCLTAKNILLSTDDSIEKNRISRLLKSGSGVSSPGDREGDEGGESSAATAKKRRQQVYQAQKCVVKTLAREQYH